MDSSSPKSALSKMLSRRGMLAALGGIGARPILGRQGRAQSQDSPPIFRTARYQFTLIRAPAELRPAVLKDLRGRAAPLAAAPGNVRPINPGATLCTPGRIELP